MSVLHDQVLYRYQQVSAKWRPSDFHKSVTPAEITDCATDKRSQFRVFINQFKV
jgi:hypothetical protein